MEENKYDKFEELVAELKADIDPLSELENLANQIRGIGTIEDNHPQKTDDPETADHEIKIEPLIQLGNMEDMVDIDIEYDTNDKKEEKTNDNNLNQSKNNSLDVDIIQENKYEIKTSFKKSPQVIIEPNNITSLNNNNLHANDVSKNAMDPDLTISKVIPTEMALQDNKNLPNDLAFNKSNTIEWSPKKRKSQNEDPIVVKELKINEKPVIIKNPFWYGELIVGLFIIVNI